MAMPQVVFDFMFPGHPSFYTEASKQPPQRSSPSTNRLFPSWAKLDRICPQVATPHSAVSRPGGHSHQTRTHSRRSNPGPGGSLLLHGTRSTVGSRFHGWHCGGRVPVPINQSPSVRPRLMPRPVIAPIPALVRESGSVTPAQEPLLLNSATSASRLALASPKSMRVFSLKKRPFSMPAKPGRIERFNTITVRARATSITGMP